MTKVETRTSRLVRENLVAKYPSGPGNCLVNMGLLRLFSTCQGGVDAGRCRLSPVSTRDAFLAVSRNKDFWFIAAARSEDETGIRSG
jgi:hypothetical protein